VVGADHSGRLGSLFSVFRKAAPAKAATQGAAFTRANQPVSPAVAERATPMAPQQPGYPTQQGTYTPSQQMAPQALAHNMTPQQATYPAPAYPYAQQMGYPQTQSWQMQPPAGYAHPRTTAPYTGQASYPQQPAYPQSPLAPSASEADQQTPIEEIRASLREFREAVQELTESRARRRYF